MTKAEERALKAYPIDMQPLRYQDYINQFGGKTEIDVNSYSRRLFQEGYEQSEKDLALTVDDIELIDQIMLDLSNAYATGNFDYELGSDEFYQETLKRFNDFKAREK